MCWIHFSLSTLQAKLFADADAYICFDWCCAYLHQNIIDPNAQNNSDSMNSPYHFVPRYFHRELRNACTIFVTVAHHFCSHRDVVLQKGWDGWKEQVGKVKGWAWYRAGHQRQLGTDLAEGNARPQPSDIITLTRRGVKWEARASHSPSKCCWASAAPGEDAVARVPRDYKQLYLVELK